jgi:glutamyl-tRNA synthetase
VVDDAAWGGTEVVRGRDLLTSTPVQLWLYRALGLTPPAFIHVPMLLSNDGRRLSKRDKALDLGELRRVWPPERVIGLLAWRCGLIDRWEDVSPRELAADFDWGRVRREDIVMALPEG